jgi:hypothetical protein
MHAGGSHRHDVGPNRGRAAHLLGDRKRSLEELVQLRTQRPVFFSRPHRIFHLAKNLRLTDDHRIKTAGHTEGMANRFRLIMRIDIWRDFMTLDLMVMRQPVDHDLG